jgi:hypothetical protein
LENHHFCPRCGQRNTHNIVALDEFLKEVFATIFNFDSRWAHTFKPFFIKPGELTKAFIGGQRMHYTDPLKLYFFASLFFFLCLSNFIVSPLGSALNEQRNTFEKKNTLSWFEIDSMKTATLDSTKSTVKAISDTFLTEIKKDADEIKKDLEKDFSKNKKKKRDSLKKKNNFSPDSFHTSMTKPDSTSNKGMYKGLLEFFHLIENRELSPEQLSDSLFRTEEDESGIFADTAAGLFIAKKLQKIGRNDFVNFIAAYIDWISFFIISLLPLFAAILSLLNFRLRRFFIENLIFTFHIQAFAYIFLGLCLILFRFWDEWLIFLLGLSVCFFYSLLAFINVYGQGWVKSSIKISMLGFFYMIALIIGLPLHGIFVFIIY